MTTETSNIVTGFDSMRRQDAAREASGGGGGGNYIRYVILGDDGDMVLFRSVTESDAAFAEKAGTPHVFIKGEFHSVPQTSKRGRAFWRDVVCGSRFDEEKEEWVGECDLCKSEVRRRTQFFSWVYVYAFYFKAQDPRYIPGDSATAKFQRKQVRRGESIFYKEDVDKFCLWQDGYYMLELLKSKIGQFGTLCDRDYMVIRHGVRKNQNTQRELEAQPPTPMPAEMLEGAAALPHLNDVALGKTRTYGGAAAAQEIPEEVDLADIPEDTMPTVEGFGAPAVSESDALYDQLEEASEASGAEPADDDFEAIFQEGPGVAKLEFPEEEIPDDQTVAEEVPTDE